jgi:hypothetical protein
MGAGAAWVTNGRQVGAKKEHNGNGQRGPKKQAAGERSKSGWGTVKKQSVGAQKKQPTGSQKGVRGGDEMRRVE